MSFSRQMTRWSVPVIAGLVLLASVQITSAQDAPPQESSGITIDSMDILPLAEQIPAMEGYVLRVRQITLEPGAIVAHHSHEQRPIAVYLISGSFTEVPDAGEQIAHGAGTYWFEDASMRHWGGNMGDVPTVLIAVDLVPEEE